MNSEPSRSLVPIDKGNWRAALEVRVTDEQLPMVADHQPVALVILAKAYVQPDDRRWEPLAFVEEAGMVVAVLALAHGEQFTEIVNLAVDAEHQGIGLGTQVVLAVFDHCRHLGVRSVDLTVNPLNEVAARLYRRVGFAPSGEQRRGEPVWTRTLAEGSSR